MISNSNAPMYTCTGSVHTVTKDDFASLSKTIADSLTTGFAALKK